MSGRVELRYLPIHMHSKRGCLAPSATLSSVCDQAVLGRRTLSLSEFGVWPPPALGLTALAQAASKSQGPQNGACPLRDAGRRFRAMKSSSSPPWIRRDGMPSRQAILLGTPLVIRPLYCTKRVSLRLLCDQAPKPPKIDSQKRRFYAAGALCAN